MAVLNWIVKRAETWTEIPDVEDACFVSTLLKVSRETLVDGVGWSAAAQFPHSISPQASEVENRHGKII